jgi:beta-glucosidase
VYARPGDRVTTWTTLSGPWCSAYLGYAAGAPRARVAGSGGRLHRGTPTTCCSLMASARTTGSSSRSCAGGTRGTSSSTSPGFTEPHFIRAGDEATVAERIDVLTINDDTPTYVAACPGAGGNAAHPGSADIALLPPAGPVCDMTRAVEPETLRRLLERIGCDHPGTPLLITENGAASPTGPVGDGAAAGGARGPTRIGSATSTGTCPPRIGRSRSAWAAPAGTGKCSKRNGLEEEVSDGRRSETT